jgi:hypothetical protein
LILPYSGGTLLVFPNHRSVRWRLWVVLVVGVAGCGKPAPVVDDRLRALDPSQLVPAGGVVTINGKPLQTVVITFLPPNGPALGTAETDKNGKYELRSMGGPGVLPGEYKVAISYLVSDQGEVQGMGARNSMIQGLGMMSAKEQLPPEYADLGRSKLSVTVGPRGGTFDYDVPAAIPTANAKAGEKAEQAKTTENEAEDTKPVAKKAESAKSAEKKE